MTLIGGFVIVLRSLSRARETPCRCCGWRWYRLWGTAIWNLFRILDNSYNNLKNKIFKGKNWHNTLTGKNNKHRNLRVLVPKKKVGYWRNPLNTIIFSFLTLFFVNQIIKRKKYLLFSFSLFSLHSTIGEYILFLSIFFFYFLFTHFSPHLKYIRLSPRAWEK